MPQSTTSPSRTGSRPGRWSFRLGRLAGIDLYVHATFLLLLGWVGVSTVIRAGWPQAAAAVLLVCAVFASVVLHELGHALAARRLGIGTRDITLLPIGGVAHLERMPERPRDELMVALAGPAVNVVLAAGLVLVMGLPEALGWRAPALQTFLLRLASINLMLALFNLVPAFPMDGGRVLRALLAMRLPPVRATLIAARLGQGVAIVMGLVGLFVNPLLVLVALFVWVGAAGEASATGLRQALEGMPVSSAMATEIHVLRPHDPLARAVDHLLAGFQQDFPVVDDDGRVLGLLGREALLAALERDGERVAVAGAMSRDVATVDAGEPLESALDLLQQGEQRALPVLRHGRLVGLLTPENLGELVLVRSARKAPVPGVRGSGAPARTGARGPITC